MAVISVLSAKGGTGKTTVSTNLGIALTGKFGKKVLLIDGNISTPSCGIHLGILSQERTLHDVLKGSIGIGQAIYIHPSGLRFVPSSLSTDSSVDPDLLKESIDEVRGMYDYIIIDGAGGVDREAVSAIRASDSVLAVVNPDIVSVLAAVKLVRMAGRFNIPVLGIVVNKSGDKRRGVSLGKIERLCESRVVGVIPFDREIPEMVSDMVPIILRDEDSGASQSFIRLASFIAGRPFKGKAPAWRRFFSLFRR